MLKIQQIFPKLYRCLLYVVFHDLKPQNAGPVDVKKDLNSKRSKGIFVIKNINWSEDPLMHKAERHSNYFFQLFHTLSSWADKERNNLCPNYLGNIPDWTQKSPCSRWNSFIYIPVLVVVLFLCSHSHNDLPPEPQQNVSMAAVWGAITCLGHSNVVFIL